MPRKLGRTTDMVSASTAHSEKTRDRLYFTPTRSPTANLPTANRHRQIPHHTKKPVTRQQLSQKLGISDTSLQLGFKTLTSLGFKINYRDRAFHITRQPETAQQEDAPEQIPQPLLDSQFIQFSVPNSPIAARFAAQFLAAVSEEQFRRKYFCEVPLSTIQSIARETVFQEESTENLF